jgi:hypothetical protein
MTRHDTKLREMVLYIVPGAHLFIFSQNFPQVMVYYAHIPIYSAFDFSYIDDANCAKYGFSQVVALGKALEAA